MYLPIIILITAIIVISAIVFALNQIFNDTKSQKTDDSGINELKNRYKDNLPK